MWMLIIFTLLANAGGGGGMSSSVTTVQFSSKELCTSAETAVATQGHVGAEGNSYQIFGKCVQANFGTVRH